ncbi:MAG TPA: ribosome-associated translation inhibitor RaiA [Candidatus Paceibacterota bacterium]|nr:ribosome-associated translation inhibitor RaiA [Candidatus Paceibacterota bacterium]
MNYNIKGTDVAVTDELRTYVEKKLSTLDKICNRDSARVDVVVAYLESEEKQYWAEMNLLDAGEPLHAETRAATLYQAIDATVNELTEELNKTKSKRKDEARHDAVKGKEMLRESEEI